MGAPSHLLLKSLHAFLDFFDDSDATDPPPHTLTPSPSSVEQAGLSAHDNNATLQAAEAVRERSRMAKRRERGEAPLQMWMLVCSVRVDQCWVELLLIISRIQGCTFGPGFSPQACSSHRWRSASRGSLVVSTSSARQFPRLIRPDKRSEASVTENSSPCPSKINALSSL